ncbi:MerR family transcriptional regulator [Chitiniphilus eburneus]|uniref:MerR family transcriptional regulator n=1 Tax=Chitiniphilus eburneus TaxID=2571148 RepID=A0A4U0Q572_9NEIS|nr:helix-turn-helix domain-containing protein [Chitiniphilus eburneus]TJZ76215.1 MerR family transcriptional regulator [Chitiniphilus eburneus]
MAETFTIGTLGKAAGVNLETVRYYERIGLLPPAPRSEGGYRRYDGVAVKRLRFIRRGRELGFGIDEIRTLLQLADHPQQPCDAADHLAQQHLAEVEAKIADLLAMRDVLARLVGCHSTSAEHCRLLETLEQRDCCVGRD